MQRIFSLVDVNNCYVSCERLFNPKLHGVPVIVLSNNDGCAVARSQEAKDLGIKMGAPLFKIKDVVQKHNVRVLSSNYALYAEMSRRFMQILGQFVTPQEQEVYSIDECFLDLTAYAQNYDLTNYAQQMRQRVLNWIGLPSCVGIGRSKTEAKIANHIAKKNPHFGGVCNLVQMDTATKQQLWQQIEVGEVWGVGFQHSKKLQSMGIHTVLDLARASPQLIRKQFSIVMQRTVLELNGTACIEIEHTPDSKKQIVASRSFGNKVTELSDLKEAVSRFAQDAVMRLRGEKQLCGCLMVFCRSNPFDPNMPFYSKALTYAFEEPTDNALLVVKMATLMMEHLYKQGIEFKKCGVSLTALSPKGSHIFDLLTDHVAIEKQEKLMQAIENVQDRYGKKKLAIGSSMLPSRTWSMSRANVSQNYFQVDGLLVVN